MSVIECPVCGRKYRFDDAKMIKEKIKVKCRKCENIFVISREMFPSTGTETSPSPQSVGKPPPPPPEDVTPMTLAIKKIPHDTARLSIATRLMPLTGERLPALSRKLLKTPALFHFEMTPTKAENLLNAIESTGADAEFSHRDVSRQSRRQGPQDLPKGRWKKWAAAAVLAFCLVVVGGLSYHMYREIQKTHALEQRGIDSVIPKGALFYIRFKDLERNWQEIQENVVNRGFGSLFESLKSTRPVQDLLSKKRDWESSMGIPFFHPDLMDLIGSDMRVALYGGNGSQRPQFVLTLKGNLKIKLLETLGEWFPLWREKVSARKMAMEHMVYAFQPQGLGREIYFFSEGMIYVVSTSPDLIQMSTSLVEGQLPTRNSLRSVSLLSKKGERTGINQIGLFYVGLKNLIGSWSGKKRSNNGALFIKYLEGYGDLVGTISYGRGLVLESTMTMHRDRLDQPLRALLECPPAPNKTLAYVPRNTIVYASNNSLDLGAYFSWLRKDLKEDRDFSGVLDKILSETRTKTGVDIEKEILPFLGKEISYAVMGPNEKGGVRFPGIQLFFEVKNRSKVEASIQRLLHKPMIRSWFKEIGVDLISTNHDDVSITSLRYQGNDMGLFFLSAITPCYAFVDDFLVIGTGIENLKEMVDLSKGRGVSMLKDRRFNETKRLFRDRNNGMAYVDLKAVSRLLREFITRGPLAGAGFAEAGGRKAEDLQTFFQVLETLNYVRSETEFGGDRVRFLVYVALCDTG